MNLQTINLADIKFADNIFSLTPILPDKAPQKLVQSIARVGLLHPPIVSEIAHGIYRIASGRNRLLAAHKLNVKSCKCFVFGATSHPLDVFNYVYEEASHTDIALISKAIFLKKTGKWLNSEELAKKFMAGLGLKGGRFQVEKLQQLAMLEINIQQALLSNQIDEKVCHELVKLDFIDRMGLFDIIISLGLSVGNQRKLLITSREVASRNQASITTFLGQDTLTTILATDSLNIPQRTAAFMTRLEELRYPLLSEAEHEFKMFTKSLPLSNTMRLSHTPAFENDQLSLTITCESRAELIKIIAKLNN